MPQFYYQLFATQPPKAITATAYKIARLFYSMIKQRLEYQDIGADYYDKQYKERILKNMHKKAFALGFQLLPIQPLGGEVP